MAKLTKGLVVADLQKKMQGKGWVGAMQETEYEKSAQGLVPKGTLEVLEEFANEMKKVVGKGKGVAR
jgi:hypothetical protein